MRQTLVCGTGTHVASGRVILSITTKHSRQEPETTHLVELLVVLLVLGDLLEHLDGLLDDVLLDHAKNLVLLEGLTTRRYEKRESKSKDYL